MTNIHWVLFHGCTTCKPLISFIFTVIWFLTLAQTMNIFRNAMYEDFYTIWNWVPQVKCWILYISLHLRKFHQDCWCLYSMHEYCLGILLNWAGMKSFFLQNPVIHFLFFESIKGYINGHEFDGIPQLPADRRDKTKPQL